MTWPRDDEPNPFSIVYDQICRTIEEKSGVRVASWNKSATPPIKDVLAEGDMPEIQVRATTSLITIANSSQDVTVVRSHDVAVNTGNFKIGAKLLPLEWRLLRAAHALKYGAFDNLLWKNAGLVTDAEVTGSTAGLVDTTNPNNRGLQGWSTLWTVAVHLMLNKEDLDG